MTVHKVKSTKLRYFALHVFGPTLIGGSIYTCWRRPTLLLFTWYRSVGLDSAIIVVRQSVSFVHHFLPGWILFSLPDALWVYAITAFMAGVWGDAKFSTLGRLWLFGGLVLAVGGELSQALGIISGTFDANDLLLCFAASVAAIVMATPSRMKNSGGVEAK
jgi:hypothetical protein